MAALFMSKSDILDSADIFGLTKLERTFTGRFTFILVGSNQEWQSEVLLSFFSNRVLFTVILTLLVERHASGQEYEFNSWLE